MSIEFQWRYSTKRDCDITEFLYDITHTLKHTIRKQSTVVCKFEENAAWIEIDEKKSSLKLKWNMNYEIEQEKTQPKYNEYITLLIKCIRSRYIKLK